MIAKTRRIIRFWVADLFYHCGLFALWYYLRTRGLGRHAVCVLGFHRVLSEEEIAQSNSLPGVVMTEATFVQLLGHLKARFNFVALDDIARGPANERDSSRPRCLVTFDDGWRDNYTRAYPWLKRQGIPAAIFLTTGFIGGKGTFWVEQLVAAWKDPAKREQIESSAASILNGPSIASGLEGIIEHLKRMPTRARHEILNQLLPPGAEHSRADAVDQMLTWDQVLEMEREGITFGSHTVTHPLLTCESDSVVDRELRGAKEVLEQRLGKNVQAFAYPNGDWDERVRQQVEQAGYTYAFTTQGGWYQRGQDPYTIPRILLHETKVTGRDGKFSPAMLALTLARGR